MSRARKGLRTPAKKRRRAKINPNRRAGLRADNGPGEMWFTPTPAEAEALEAIFGPAEGRVVAVGMSDNLRI